MRLALYHLWPVRHAEHTPHCPLNLPNGQTHRSTHYHGIPIDSHCYEGAIAHDTGWYDQVVQSGTIHGGTNRGSGIDGSDSWCRHTTGQDCVLVQIVCQSALYSVCSTKYRSNNIKCCSFTKLDMAEQTLIATNYDDAGVVTRCDIDNEYDVPICNSTRTDVAPARAPISYFVYSTTPGSTFSPSRPCRIWFGEWLIHQTCGWGRWTWRYYEAMYMIGCENLGLDNDSRNWKAWVSFFTLPNQSTRTYEFVSPDALNTSTWIGLHCTWKTKTNEKQCHINHYEHRRTGIQPNELNCANKTIDTIMHNLHFCNFIFELRICPGGRDICIWFQAEVWCLTICSQSQIKIASGGYVINTVLTITHVG